MMYKINSADGWTKQDMIDLIMDWVPKKGSRLGTRCAYRDGKGGACAIGAFIPSGEYFAEMEFCITPDVLDCLRARGVTLPLDDEGMIQMQIKHDACSRLLGVDTRQKVVEWIEKRVTA